MVRASRTAVDHDRRRRSLDLRLLGEMLLNSGACEDIGPLESAANQCVSGWPAGGDWSYDVTLLMFRLQTLAGLRPLGLNPIFAKLSVSLIGRHVADLSSGDPFAKLLIDFAVTGTLSSAGNSMTTIAAWHFDRHVGKPGEQGSAVHPLYHAQYGGREMQAIELGETLLCDAPRLMYPPMDAILAVDFVTSNFLYDYWLKLRQDHGYVRLVTQSYREFWLPWFSCINAAWTANPHVGWNERVQLCPTLPRPDVSAIASSDTNRSDVRSRKHRRNRK